MNHPEADLTGYTRDRNAEKAFEWSAPCILISLVGIAGLVLALWTLPDFFDPDKLPLFLAGQGTLIVSVMSMTAYVRKAKVGCAQCGREMERRKTNLDEKDASLWATKFFIKFDHAGRHYGYSRKEEDSKEWVRLTRTVACCDDCKAYAVLGRFDESVPDVDDFVAIENYVAGTIGR